MTTEEDEALAEFILSAQTVLETDLSQLWLFGSAARNDRWKPHQGSRSDIDVLVVLHKDVEQQAKDRLYSMTYPLFLMCGSQISLQFRTVHWIANPPDERAEKFVEQLQSDAVGLFPSSIARSSFNQRSRSDRGSAAGLDIDQG